MPANIHLAVEEPTPLWLTLTPEFHQHLGDGFERLAAQIADAVELIGARKAHQQIDDVFDHFAVRNA